MKDATSRPRRYSTAVNPDRVQRSEELLARYPDITAEEKEELIDFLKRAPALDTALITTVDEIRPQLEQFRSDHRGHFGLGPRQYLVLTAIIIVILSIVALSWNIAGK